MQIPATSKNSSKKLVFANLGRLKVERLRAPLSGGTEPNTPLAGGSHQPLIDHRTEYINRFCMFLYVFVDVVFMFFVFSSRAKRVVFSSGHEKGSDEYTVYRCGDEYVTWSLTPRTGRQNPCL